MGDKLELNAQGYIMCLECDSPWCIHTETAMRNGDDSKLIFWDENAERPDSDFLLMIPMFPSKNHWTNVSLVPSEDGPYYEVHWGKPVGGFPENYQIVTYLSRGDGRFVIREALYQMMLGDRERTFECKSSSHGFAQEGEWQKELREHRAAAEWCLYIYGVCPGCLFAVTSLDDLVPDKEGSPWK